MAETKHRATVEHLEAELMRERARAERLAAELREARAAADAWAARYVELVEHALGTGKPPRTPEQAAGVVENIARGILGDALPNVVFGRRE